jgi:hypothetical protein
MKLLHDEAIESIDEARPLALQLQKLLLRGK